MATRNRIIYQNEGIYVGPSFKNGESYSTPISTNLDRVQSVSYDFSYERTPLTVIGKGGSIDTPITSAPSTSITVNYYLNSFHNESAFGLYVMPEGSSSKFTPIYNLINEVDRSNDRRNIYLATMPEGKDLIGQPSDNIESVLSFHDCQIQSYEVNFAVGSLPEASIALKGIDANYYTSGVDLSVPILNKKDAKVISNVNVTGMPAAQNHSSETIVPGNISVSVKNNGTNKFAGVDNDKIQSFDCNFNVNRQAIDLVGYKITNDNILNYPIDGNASISIIEDGGESDSLVNLITGDASYDIHVKIKNKAGAVTMSYNFLGIKINGIDLSNDIGSNKTTNLNFYYELNPDSSEKGLFISGQT